jgi:hypothetical protein
MGNYLIIIGLIIVLGFTDNTNPVIDLVQFSGVVITWLGMHMLRFGHGNQS